MPIYKSRQDIRDFWTHLEEETKINSMRNLGIQTIIQSIQKIHIKQTV